MGLSVALFDVLKAKRKSRSHITEVISQFSYKKLYIQKERFLKMPLPGLVAYGSDSDSDGSDTEETNVAVATVPSSSRTVDDNISDEEDFVAPANTANADADLFDVPAEPDLLSLI